MCGIVASASKDDVISALLQGLGRLEYRGYDSCGLAVGGHTLNAIRSTLRVDDLCLQASENALTGSSGIAHTRWATHGPATMRNAHPFLSRRIGEKGSNAACTVAVVHNGIIENFSELRTMLTEEGYAFESDTDSEVIAHLISRADGGSLFERVKTATAQLRGSFAIAVLSSGEPGKLVGASTGSSLVVGRSDRGMYIASDTLALVGLVDEVAFLSDHDVVALDVATAHAECFTGSGFEPRALTFIPLTQQQADTSLGPYQHRMHREIYEQPEIVASLARGLDLADASRFGIGRGIEHERVDRILILGCGSSYYAGLLGKYWLERIAGLPTAVDLASEFRYRTTPREANTLVIAISQSGETADTIAALQLIESFGESQTLAICNVESSAIVRRCDFAFLTGAGIELGVASTKGFLTQLMAMYALSYTLAGVRDRLNADQLRHGESEMLALADQLSDVLTLEPEIYRWATELAAHDHAIYIGRGTYLPIALEGALKLKEIAYVHAEGFAAGELKHGPLALVSPGTPVVAFMPDDELSEKMRSNIEEVLARGATVFAITQQSSTLRPREGLKLLRLKDHSRDQGVFLYTVVAQLLAYHAACIRGTDVDKPRNLAKSVTVE